MIEHILGVLKQWFRILLLPPCYPLNFQPHIPAALCALQNFIQEIDQDEGELPTDSYQAPYEPFPSDVNSDRDDGGFIIDDDEGNSDFKLHRMNIANEIWESYLQYTAEDDDDSLSE